MCAHGRSGLQPWPRNALRIRCLYHFQALQSSRQQTPNWPDNTALQLAVTAISVVKWHGRYACEHNHGVLFLMHKRRQHTQVKIKMWSSWSIYVLDKMSEATPELRSQTCTARFELQECADHADVRYVQDLCSVLEDQ